MRHVVHFTPNVDLTKLFLVSPACILSFLLVAVVRGELREAWNWSADERKPAVDVDALPEAKPVGLPGQTMDSNSSQANVGAEAAKEK